MSRSFSLRLRLEARKKPYTVSVARGIRLAYRRNQSAGVWSVLKSDGAGGSWLFGEYSIADAMYAPVALRFNTYGASISQTARWYIASVLEDAPMQEWLAAAKQETWSYPGSEVG